MKKNKAARYEVLRNIEDLRANIIKEFAKINELYRMRTVGQQFPSGQAAPKFPNGPGDIFRDTAFDKYNDLKNRFDKLVETNAYLRTANMDMQQKNAAQAKWLQDAETKSLNEKSELGDTIINQARNNQREMEELIAAKTKAERLLEDVKGEILHWKSNFDNAESHRKDLVHDITVANNAIMQLSNTNTQLRAQCRNWKGKWKLASNGGKVVTLTEDGGWALHAPDVMQMTSQISNLVQASERYRDEIKHHQNVINDLQALHYDDGIQIAGLKKLNDQQLTDIIELKARIAEMESQEKGYQADIENAERSVERLQNDLSDWKHLNDERNEIIEDLQNQLMNLQKREES